MGNLCGSCFGTGHRSKAAPGHRLDDVPMQPMAQPTAAPARPAAGAGHQLGAGRPSGLAPTNKSPLSAAAQPDRAAMLAAAERRAQAAQARGSGSSRQPGPLAQKLAQQQKMSSRELQEQEQRENEIAQNMVWRGD
ncbi:hypothetical protein H4R34_001984 [Dimargaris verticillata]|uniref:Small VCP/p97-interacting protein n=1 Tax=Dimargaris verticillata TaxID=2761393 RepID=A0A9W8B4K0_9FUNG|nr:hypothetical protein H4R34_001984 [Dimargaris verticillata]